MPVPKTTMSEYHRPIARQHDIRFARKRAIVESEAKTPGMKPFAENHFGPRVCSADPGHHPASSGRGDDVSHLL